jgi:ATP-dependent Clp protease adaptor protein ClpS
MNLEQPQEISEIENEDNVSLEHPYKVVLFNDDYHSFDEVINQLIKAIRCTYDEARNYAFEAHVKGKAIIYNGSLTDCLKVTTVLEEISLHTQIVS